MEINRQVPDAQINGDFDQSEVKSLDDSPQHTASDSVCITKACYRSHD